MAFYREEEFDGEGNLVEGEQIGFKPGGSSAFLGGSGEGGALPAAKGAPGQPDNPGNFVGLHEYLKANKTQADQYGQRVAGAVGDSISQAEENIGGLVSSFQGVADEGLISNFDTAEEEGTGIINTASTGGAQNQINEDQTSRFGDIANAQYTGPQTVEETEVFNPVAQSVRDAQNLANLSATEGGSQQLAREVSDPDRRYTQGSSRLDSYMLNSPENRERLAQARQGAEALTGGLEGASGEAQAYAQGLEQQTNELREKIRSLLGNTAMANSGAVQNEIAALESQVNENNQIISDLEDSFSQSEGTDILSLTPAQMELLGLQEGQGLYGANFQNYSSMLPGQVAFDPNQALSQDQYAQLNALAGLAGTYGGEFTNPYAGAGDLAGGVDYTQPVDFSGVQTSVGEAKSDYDKKYETPTNFFNSLNRTRGASPKQVQQMIDELTKQWINPRSSKQVQQRMYNQHVMPLKKMLDAWKASQGGNQRVQSLTNFQPPVGMNL